ncbi:MAG: hypothetical protein OXU23_17650, partial [Candidatus Poribacteria bacterium]|nr:hypothetical protein [Candidatus Poribacteria bacterium]
HGQHVGCRFALPDLQSATMIYEIHYSIFSFINDLLKYHVHILIKRSELLNPIIKYALKREKITWKTQRGGFFGLITH